MHLQPLVVAVRGLAGTVDVALHPGRGRHHDHGGVDIVQLADRRVHQRAADRGDRRGLLPEHEAGEVEVMDHHVPEQPPGHAQVGRRRRLRVTAADDHLMDHADGTARGQITHASVGRVEAAVEADLDRHAGIAHRLPALFDALQAQIDRLFAQHRLAGGGGGDDQGHVRVGGRGDQHRIDPRGQRRSDVRHGRRSVTRGDRRRHGRHRIVHAHQPGIRSRGEVGGMHGADPPRTQECEIDHAPSYSNRTPLTRRAFLWRLASIYGY